MYNQIGKKKWGEKRKLSKLKIKVSLSIHEESVFSSDSSQNIQIPEKK